MQFNICSMCISANAQLMIHALRYIHSESRESGFFLFLNVILNQNAQPCLNALEKQVRWRHERLDKYSFRCVKEKSSGLHSGDKHNELNYRNWPAVHGLIISYPFFIPSSFSFFIYITKSHTVHLSFCR